MEFRKEALVDREKEIGNYLLADLPIKSIGKKTGLRTKTVLAHIRNMMKKLCAHDSTELMRILKKLDP